MSDDKITLKNEHLEVTASARGAELHSVRLDGSERLWTGDPAVWRRHAPVLFPFVGRCFEGRYKLNGEEYSMGCHGFCQDALFSVIACDDTHVVFELTDSAETYAAFPFRFSFKVGYALSGRTVLVSYTAENRSPEIMHFGIGAHPGFLVPMEEKLSFEDYFLEFPCECRPDRVVLSDENVLVTGERRAYPLEGGKRLRLTHDLFDQDAVVLEHSGSSVCIRSEKGTHSVTVEFPQMPWVGFWHVQGEASYVCVEPWVSLPGREGVVEEFSARRDLMHLPQGETYYNIWSFTLR